MTDWRLRNCKRCGREFKAKNYQQDCYSGKCYQEALTGQRNRAASRLTPAEQRLSFDAKDRSD